jgi:exodeoxyribonuclease VII large subunit
MSKESHKIYSLGKLTKALENHFMDHFSQKKFWVTAEVVKINSKSGHFYLELADSKNDRTTALCNATLWSTQAKAIQQSLGKEYDLVLKPGNKVLFEVRIEYHSIYGLKLNVLSIDPSYTYGDIEQRKKETIAQLKREGIHDWQQRLRLSLVAKRIALIGSPETSGFRDFKDELFNNESYRNFKVKEFHTPVQGAKAKSQLVSAIEEAAQYDVDAIVIIRGGGSKMDLDLFNDYAIARAICYCKKPVLTGIGHETDNVVADFVAHQKFITPTAVGKFLWVRIREFRYFTSKYYDQVTKKSQELLAGAKDEFYHKNKYLIHFTKELLQEWQEVFNSLTYRINKKSQRFIHEEKEGLTSLTYLAQKKLNNIIRAEQYRLDEQLNSLKYKALTNIHQEKDIRLEKVLQKTSNCALSLLDTEKIRLKNKEEVLALLNPEKLLQQGYTITTFKNIDVQNVELVQGQEIKTLTSKSLITSRILTIEKKKNE